MSFDTFGQVEVPPMYLCNPNKSQLHSLELGYNIQVNKRFNALSELSFSFPQMINPNDEPLPAYALLKSKRLVEVTGYGYFIIDDVQENEDGSVPIKEIHCSSLEAELIGKNLNVFGGTYPLYDLLSPEESILGFVVQQAPLWSIGYVDPQLLNKFRTFDSSPRTIYSFLMTSIEEAFSCVFSFDTETRTISAYTNDTATTQTDVYVSFDNLIENLQMKEIADEITTCLKVYGAGNLDIRSVNPLGGVSIYNFDYFKTTDWMSQELIDAIDAWQAEIDAVQTTYANTLTTLKTSNSELIVLNSEMTDLVSEYQALEQIQSLRIISGEELATVNAQLIAKQAEIDSKQVEIDSKQFEIDSLVTTLSGINDSLSFANNFSESEYNELTGFIYENTYQNENIVQLDSMTAVEIQEQAQYLYEQGTFVLSRVSSPRYELEINLSNYTYLSGYQNFSDATDVGIEVTVEKSDGTIITLVLLEIRQTLDNPTNFSMTFSNRLRLDDGRFVYADLVGRTIKTGQEVSFNAMQWGNWDANYKGDVTNFITSSLDASKNAIINAENQEITIEKVGLRARSYNESTQSYDPNQVWLTSNTLAFTRDNWLTAGLAIGEIEVDGVPYFGVVADAIVGRLLAGESLVIQNEGSNFVLDATGATLTNARFTLENLLTKITLDPDVGFKIENNVGGTWYERMYIDGSGNIVFAGDLSGASGTFSGAINASVGNIGTLIIDSLGLKTSDGVNYLRGDGTLKWGGLSISPSSAVFSGDIYANRLVGQIVTNQISNGAVTDPILGSGQNASKIGYNSMSGNRVYGGVIGGSGMGLNVGGTGVPYLTGTGAVRLEGNSGWVEVRNYIYGYTPGSITWEGSYINLSTGDLRINGTGCISGLISVTTPYGNMYLTFTEGLLTRYQYY